MISKGVKEIVEDLNEALKIDKKLTVVLAIADFDDKEMINAMNGHTFDMYLAIASILRIIRQQTGTSEKESLKLIKEAVKAVHFREKEEL